MSVWPKNKVALVLTETDLRRGADPVTATASDIRCSMVPAYEAFAIVLEVEKDSWRVLKHIDSRFTRKEDERFTEEGIRSVLEGFVPKTLNEILRDLRAQGKVKSDDGRE